MIDKKTLSNFVEEGLTIEKMSHRLKRSTSTISRYLKKYSLTPAHGEQRKDCMTCGKPLSGRRRKFCSNYCKTYWYNHYGSIETKGRSQLYKRFFKEKRTSFI